MRIFKLLISLTLFVFIIFIFLFIALLYYVKFDYESYFSKRFKNQIIKYPSLVKFVNLDQPGDARYIYLNPRLNTIDVNVFYSVRTSPNQNIQNWIEQMISLLIVGPVFGFIGLYLVFVVPKE